MHAKIREHMADSAKYCRPDQTAQDTPQCRLSTSGRLPPGERGEEGGGGVAPLSKESGGCELVQDECGSNYRMTPARQRSIRSSSTSSISGRSQSHGLTCSFTYAYDYGLFEITR